MNHTTSFRPEFAKMVAFKLGYILTVLLAACGFRQLCLPANGELAAGRSATSEEPNGSKKGENHNNNGNNQDEEYRLYGAKTSYDEVREKTVEEVKIPGKKFVTIYCC